MRYAGWPRAGIARTAQTAATQQVVNMVRIWDPPFSAIVPWPARPVYGTGLRAGDKFSQCWVNVDKTGCKEAGIFVAPDVKKWPDRRALADERKYETVVLIMDPVGGPLRDLRGLDGDLRKSRRRADQFGLRHLDPDDDHPCHCDIDRLGERRLAAVRQCFPKDLSVPAAVRDRHRRVLALLLPRTQAGAGVRRGAGRQDERAAGGAVRGAVSGRAPASA